MKYLRNREGVALVVALMFSLVCLGMILTLLYFVLTGTLSTAAKSRYGNIQEASYGGADFVSRTVIPRLFSDYSGGKNSLTGDFGAADGYGLVLGPDLRQKMHAPTALWTRSASVNPKEFPDVVFTLPGQSGNQDFKVYAKIVDSSPGVGLLDGSGIDYLDGGIGVAGSGSGVLSKRTPNMFTFEVQGEKAVKPKEKSNLTVLYAY